MSWPAVAFSQFLLVLATLNKAGQSGQILETV